MQLASPRRRARRRARRTIAGSLLVPALAIGAVVLPATAAQAAPVGTVVAGVFFVADDADPGAGATITNYNPTAGATVVIPDTVTIGGVDYSVKNIGASAFQGRDLTSVTIPTSVTSIGDGAFADNLLTDIVLPDSVTSLGKSAFFGNPQLASATLPQNLTVIPDNSFRNTALTSISIPASVTTIGLQAFNNSRLQSITIPSSVQSIGNFAFAANDLENLDFAGPSSLVSLGNSAFRMNKLTAVTLPDTLTTVNSQVFQYNPLVSVTIPEGITSIGNQAFANPNDLGALSSITIPASVTTIGASAFGGNPALTEVHLLGAPPQITPGGAVGQSFASPDNKTLFVSDESYVTPSWPLWQGYHVYLPRTVTFDANDGSGPLGVVEVNHGTVGGDVVQPSDPARSGYDFSGWFTDAAATIPFDDAAPVTADTTVYAGWTLRAVTTPTPETPVVNPPAATPPAVSPHASAGALASTGGNVPWALLVIGGLFAIAGSLVLVIRRAVR